MESKVAVLQSNYIPWKGYFDIIHDVDLFIFYDDVQYTKNDWRNRNKIVTASGPQWLTIPTGTDLNRLICDVRLESSAWAGKHWKTIAQSYSKAGYFNMYKEFFEEVYLGMRWENLSELNHFLIEHISKRFLGIQTRFEDSRTYEVSGQKLPRLINLLEKVQAGTYVSGPSAKSYIDASKFREAKIALEYKDYSGYPEYRQIHQPFDHYVSIIDLLFNCGPDSPYFIWGWRESGSMGDGGFRGNAVLNV